jgi:hypothetical protein
MHAAGCLVHAVLLLCSFPFCLAALLRLLTIFMLSGLLWLVGELSCLYGVHLFRQTAEHFGWLVTQCVYQSAFLQWLCVVLHCPVLLSSAAFDASNKICMYSYAKLLTCRLLRV